MANIENKKLEILVVEDSPIHQEGAREQLAADNNLTVVGSFDEAVDLFTGEDNFYGKKGTHHYDVLLTDLMFPQGRGDGQSDKSHAGEIQPFGYVLAMIAGKKGIPNIAVITDGNHHQNSMTYAMDFFHPYHGGREPVQVGNGKVLFVNQGTEINNDKYKGGKGQKNWKAVLEKLLEDE